MAQNNGFAFMAFLAVCCFVFSLCTVISYDKSTMLSLSWFTGTGTTTSDETITWYFSVRGDGVAVSDGSYDDDFQSWTWGDCAANWDDNSNDDAASFCQYCKDSLGATFAFSVLALAFSVPTLILTLARLEDVTNTPGAKTWGALCAFAGMLAGIICLSVYGGQCKAFIQTWFNNNIGEEYITWEDGPVLGLMITYIIFQFFIGVGHANIPSGAAAPAASPATTTSTANPVVELGKN